MRTLNNCIVFMYTPHCIHTIRSQADLYDKPKYIHTHRKMMVADGIYIKLMYECECVVYSPVASVEEEAGL